MKRSDVLTLISIYHYFVAALFAFGACFMVAGAIIVGMFSAQDAALVGPIVAVVAIFAVLVLLAFAAFFGLVGWGLWTLKPWARLGAIVLAGLSLLCVPIGTIIGAVILWYLFQAEARVAFGEDVGPKTA